MATYLCKHLNWNPKRIISTGTALDSARLQKELAHIFNISNRSITAYCLGEHGGSAMVPWSHVCVQGKPLEQLQQEIPQRFPTLDNQQVLDDVKTVSYTHLDVYKRQELSRALRDFKGTIVLVSHEPEFYQGWVTDIWNIEDWTTKIV